MTWLPGSAALQVLLAGTSVSAIRAGPMGLSRIDPSIFGMIAAIPLESRCSPCLNSGLVALRFPALP